MGRLGIVLGCLGGVLRRLRVVFEASVGVLGPLVDALGPSGGGLVGVVGAS